MARAYIVDLFEALKRSFEDNPLPPPSAKWRARWSGRRTCPHVLGHVFSPFDDYCERCGKARAYAEGKMLAYGSKRARFDVSEG